MSSDRSRTKEQEIKERIKRKKMAAECTNTTWLGITWEAAESKLCERPSQYAPAPCTGSAQRQPWARRPSLARWANTRHPSRPAAHAARRPDVRDRRQTHRRQTDVRHHHRLMPPRGHSKLCGRPPRYAPALCKLTFDLLTLKVVSKSRVTWPTSVPILVFLGLSVLDLGPMYAIDTETDRRQTRIIA